MSKFTTQSYYSTAVKLLHCSITDTLIIHNTIQPGSEKGSYLIWPQPAVGTLYCTIVQRNLRKLITYSVSQLNGNLIRISLPVIRIRIIIFPSTN